jgi:hypothetical protein
MRESMTDLDIILGLNRLGWQKKNPSSFVQINDQRKDS